MTEDKLLTITEAADYLKVNESVVNEMLNTGVIKKQGSAKNYSIDKDDIDTWLSTLNPKEEENLAMKRIICHFQDYFKLENIILDFTADNKYESIATMSKKARDLKIVKDHRWLYEVVVAREELVSTAVGKGVAMLHPRHMHPTKIKQPTVLFGRSAEGVEFDAPDDQPVNLFFMLLLHNDKQHLFSLSFITKFLMHEKNINLLNQAKTAEEVYNAISSFEAQSKNSDKN
ncbi:MAG: PTS sugar transporter subunit IIA [Candidatus Cloacimonetes bacterium]|nr:PTS sugar transporter subunit IIA [Candidatus Cloacimonadota bacterium]MDD4156005.1 PTS sugar transporter subunit IIA [Candidatus Cloacimonadota bacterium]